MLATIGIVDGIFRRVGLRPSRFHSCAWGMAVSLPSERDGTERKRHCFFYSYCNFSLTGIAPRSGCSYKTSMWVLTQEGGRYTMHGSYVFTAYQFHKIHYCPYCSEEIL